MKTVQELIAEARAATDMLVTPEGSPTSYARKAIEALCRALEQMQTRPVELGDGEGPLYTVDQVNAAVREDRERIAKLFEVGGWVARYIRESAP